MEIRTFDTAEQTAAAVAARIAEVLRCRPDVVLGLPTGRTPIPVYAELRRLHASGCADVARAQTFNLDEFAGLRPSDPGSFRHFMDEHLFRAVNLDRSRIHFLDGTARDLDAECDRYEDEIERAGGIGLMVLGIGSNGHIGFNEPAGELVARTHRVRLHDSTRHDNAGPFGGNPDQVPHEALSMGMGTILKAEALVLIATGERKAGCIERVVHGPVTPRLPASFLQLHRRVELYLDRGAASRL